jgi:hypothetical protein
MDTHEIKIVVDYGVKGRENEVLTLIKLPYKIHHNFVEEAEYNRNIFKLFNNIKCLYEDHAEGVIKATLTIENEDLNI